MTTDTTAATLKVAARDTLVTSLSDAHALEKQTIAVLETQLKLLGDHPDLLARVSAHITAGREQARRLEGALEACGSSASVVKGTLLSVMGFGQSSVAGFGDDAVLKAVVADRTTAHLEIATYRTLIALAELADMPDLRPRLEESLREEEAMAAWFDDNLAAIVRRFVEVKAADLQPDTAPQDTAPGDEAAPTLWQTLETARATSTMPGAGEGPDTPDSPTPKPAASATSPADGRHDG